MGVQWRSERDLEPEMGSHRDGEHQGDTEIAPEREAATPSGYQGALHPFLGLGQVAQLPKLPPSEVIGSLE